MYVYVRKRDLLVTLIGGLLVAGCASDGALLGDTSPLPINEVPLPRPNPRSLIALQVTPRWGTSNWQHVPEPVSVHQFIEDKTKCVRMANSAPGAGSPEMKFYLAFTSCMHSEGYQEVSSR